MMIVLDLLLLLSFLVTGSISYFSYAFGNIGDSGITSNKSMIRSLDSIDFDSIIKRAKEVSSPTWISNPEFIFLNNQSRKVTFGLQSYWNNSIGTCEKNGFQCTSNITTGWKDHNSFQISTNITDKNTWSFIYGKEINVNPAEQYQVQTHMKLNEFATQSHIAIEGYDNKTKQWDETIQITQCPEGTNGPLEWHDYSCKMTIPANKDKIRPILNAGWSSQPGKQAVTLFGPIYITESESIVNAPIVYDPNLKVELVSKGLEAPVSIAFLGPDDILLLQKDNGTVVRIVNGSMLSKPLLKVNVATQAERGLLGIAATNSYNNSKNGSATYVFLYHTQSGGGKTGDDINDRIKPLGNLLYRYELVNNKLINPKLLLNLPAKPGPFHNGGKVIIGYDNNLYLAIGDVFGNGTKVQNFENGTDPDGRGGILRITQDGKLVGKGILGDKFPLNLYYAYGIRNSFGIAFDPLTKKLWDTENGPRYGDEINLVEPGFNSGWMRVQGLWEPNDEEAGPLVLNPNNLVDFNGKGEYSAPELTWMHNVGPTALAFLNSTKLGKQYENDMFVGDFNTGSVYHFKLNKNRTALLLNGSLLADRIVDKPKEIQRHIIATGFGGITDIKVGPDGYLYVISMDKGKIYRIVPDNKLS